MNRELAQPILEQTCVPVELEWEPIPVVDVIASGWWREQPSSANDNVAHRENTRTSDPTSRRNVLPPSLPPRGLSRAEAAAYIGVSPSTFDTMIRDGRMPVAKKIGARTVWDRLQLDRSFAELPDAEVQGRPDDATDVWDRAAV